MTMPSSAYEKAIEAGEDVPGATADNPLPEPGISPDSDQTEEDAP